MKNTIRTVALLSVLCLATAVPGLNLYFTEEQRNHCWFVCMILQELEHARNTLNALSMGGDD